MRAAASGVSVGTVAWLLHGIGIGFATWLVSGIGLELEDLFVDPACRSAGVGQQLIDWLVEEMKVKRWSRLYWHTRENNYRARGLYDKYTPHSGFVRYVVNAPAA